MALDDSPLRRLIGQTTNKSSTHTRCAVVIWTITTYDLFLACSDRLMWLCLGRKAAFSRSVGRSVRVLPETHQASTAVASLYLSDMSASLSLLDFLPALQHCALVLCRFCSLTNDVLECYGLSIARNSLSSLIGDRPHRRHIGPSSTMSFAEVRGDDRTMRAADARAAGQGDGYSRCGRQQLRCRAPDAGHEPAQQVLQHAVRHHLAGQVRA